ncbi:IS3 family transposase [Streptomyces sp. NPDC057743]|uniref:IS3 family transposase n=1 Tax=Streptomyces sp. NPDC057743 TaxID=3346236 RepID=UPI003683D8B7
MGSLEQETRKKCAFPVEFMCVRLGVSKSGYYDWRNRPDSATTLRRRELKLLIQKAFEVSDSTYGYRRIHAQLGRWGHRVGLELVRQLMRELSLVSCQPRPRRWSLTQAADGAVPDLVGRDFTAKAPGEQLVGDITYIPTGEGWLHLATVIDCCTKEVVGYALGDHYRTPLIVRAIRNAARNRKLAKGAIFHNDRGSEGGFNWSSQHLDHGGVRWDESRSRRCRRRLWERDGSGRRSGAAAADAFTGPAGAVSCGAAGLLAADRVWSDDGRGRGGCWRFMAGRIPVVPSRWRHVTDQPGRAHRPLSVVR